MTLTAPGPVLRLMYLRMRYGAALASANYNVPTLLQDIGIWA